MIQAHELRIGNLVNFTYRHKKEYLSRPVRVTEIRTDYVMTDDKGLPLQLHYRGGAISPIPLSPDILEKCGAVNVRDDYWIITGDLLLSLDKHWWCTNSWHAEENGFEADAMWKQIDHFHHLQNLYFALTGKELTLNL